MELREIFRAQNLRLKQQDGSVCTLTFNLIEGELLGVHVPRIHQEQSVVSKALMYRSAVVSGGIFFYETEYGAAPPAQGWPSVACVQAKNSLVEDMTVMDNLFLLRKRKNKGSFYSKRQLMREAARQMESFDLPFLPHQTIESLSDMEKHVLEVFKAYLHGAQIIILDQIAWDSTVNDTVKLLLSLIERLKREGITFLIISDRLNNLRSCADRIAFFDGTQIVVILENIPENRVAITETFDALVRGLAKERHHKITYLERGEPILFSDPVFSSLNLARGEKVALYDTQGFFFRHIDSRNRKQHVPLVGGSLITKKSKWNKWKERPRVVVADFGKFDQIFEFLPAMDNVLLGRSHGLKVFDVAGRKYREMLKREFAEQFGDDQMLDIKDSRFLQPEQRFKLYLFKLMLLNPDVVIAWHNPKADPVLVNLLEDAATALVKDNKTVCYLLLDIFEQVEDVERYILVTERGVESFSTYGELLRRQMMWDNPVQIINRG